jgi:ATP-binding cassette subfamily F protein uup
VDIVAGGYEDWAKRRRQAQAAPKAKPTSAAVKSKPAASTKLSYKDQRDLDRLPLEIERLEAAIAADEDALHDPDLFARDPKRFAELTERIAHHRAEKDAAEHRWLEVAEMAEALQR